MNFPAILVAAIVPLVVGAVWYNPKVMGAAWMKANGFTTEDVQGGNLAVMFGLTFVLGILIALMTNFLVVHQGHVFSLIGTDPAMQDATSELSKWYTQFVADHGDRHRSFGHGAFHGALSGFFLTAGIVGTISIFERRSFRYVAIHVAYWTITVGLMGGIICAWV